MIMSPAITRALAIAEATLPELQQHTKERSRVNKRWTYWAWLTLIEGFSTTQAVRRLRFDHTTAVYAVQKWAVDRMGLPMHSSLSDISIAMATWCEGLRALAFLVPVEIEDHSVEEDTMELHEAA